MVTTDEQLPSGKHRFPDLLRELEGAKAELGVSGYGLSETTLEEVFLTVTSQGKGPRSGSAAAGHVAVAVGPPAVAAASPAGAERRPLLRGDSDDLGEGGSEYEGDLRRPTRVQVPATILTRLPSLNEIHQGLPTTLH